MPRADREVRAIPCAGKGRRAAGAAARTRQDQIRNLRCDQKVSAPMRRMERVGEATGKQGIGVRYKYCGNTDRKQGVLFSKNGFEFSGSKIDRAFSFTKLDRHFTCLQQQTLHWAALLGNLSAAVGNYRSAFAALFGGMGGSTREEPAAPGPGGKLDTIPLPPAGSPGGVSAEQLQRKPGESPEEYIARITALLNAAAEAMAIAAMEHRRRLREQKNRPHVKL